MLTDKNSLIPRTVPQALENGLRWSNRQCIDFAGEGYTFAEVRKMTMRYAHGLEALGVRRGDRVSYMLDNSPDMVFLWYATMVLGAVAAPINTAFRGEFLRHQVANSDPRIFVVESHYLDRFAEIEESLPEIETLVCHGESKVKTRLPPMPIANLPVEDDSIIERDIQPSDLAMLLYTSGTTGPSKGCMIPHGYLLSLTTELIYSTSAREGDIFWTPLPLFHGGGCIVVLGSMALGVSTSVSQYFSLSNFWPEVERSGATAVMLVARLLTLIADAQDTEVSTRCHGQLRIVAGGPQSPALQETWKRRFGVEKCWSGTYAITEVGPALICDPSVPSPPDSSGRRNELFDVEIVDDEDSVCPPGVEGEIVVRPRKPDIMFSGYWKQPEQTTKAWQNGWFHTGDIGRFDEEGWFYWVDRKKDYLRRGGENISSFEMETVFRAHPAISEVAVHAVKSELGEDDLKVTAILAEGASLSEEELCRWSIDQVPFYAVPRYIEFREDIPRTVATGRVQKYKLREEGVTPATWDRENSNIIVAGRVKAT